MTKLLRTALLTAVFATSLFSEVVFDLGAQQFYYSATPITTKGTDSDGNSIDVNESQYVEASYDLNKTIASTGLASVNGYYSPEIYGSGHFGVQIKDPKPKWGVTFSMYAYIGEYGKRDGCGVQLLSDDGQTITIHFDYGSVSVAGVKKVDNDLKGGMDISGDIQMSGDSVEVTINGKDKFSINKPGFKLAKVDISLHTESSNYTDMIDKLNNLSISASD